MNPDPKFQQAIHAEFVWKNEEVRAFAVALVRHALAQNENFTTDIVPDAERAGMAASGSPPGTGVPGTCIEILKNAGLLESVGVWKLLAGGHQDKRMFFQHRIKSTRPGSNARYINVYKLTSRALAEEFIKRHGHVPLQQQLSLV